METVEINRLESAIEAILFTMGDSVELGKIASAIEHDEETTRKIVHQMMDKYQAERSWNPDRRTGGFFPVMYEKAKL